MKVYEVKTELTEEDVTTTTIQYVTHYNDSLLGVTEYYSSRCADYGEELIGVTELLTVSHVMLDAEAWKPVQLSEHQKLTAIRDVVVEYIDRMNDPKPHYAYIAHLLNSYSAKMTPLVVVDNS